MKMNSIRADKLALARNNGGRPETTICKQWFRSISSRCRRSAARSSFLVLAHEPSPDPGCGGRCSSDGGRDSPATPGGFCFGHWPRMICFATGDRIFSREFMEPLKDMGIREVLGAPRVLVRKNKNRRYAAFFARPVCSQNRIRTDLMLITRFPLRVGSLGPLALFISSGRADRRRRRRSTEPSVRRFGMRLSRPRSSMRIEAVCPD